MKLARLFWWRRSGFPSLRAAVLFDIGYWIERGKQEASQ